MPWHILNDRDMNCGECDDEGDVLDRARELNEGGHMTTFRVVYIPSQADGATPDDDGRTAD